MARKAHDRKVDHPDFRGSSVGSHTNKGHVIFIFERSVRQFPTPMKVADYERRRKIVEANGGRMLVSAWELGERNPAYTAADVEAIKRLVAKTHRALRIVEHWNGEACYSLTVACLPRKK